MSNATKKLTRAQLAEFLPDPRAIRAFEQILMQTTELLPSDIATLNRLIQETGFAADGAMAGVASALAQILDLAHQSAVNESTADSKATAALALAGQLARQLEAALVAPPPAEPYLERMHDVRMLSPQDGDFIQYNATKHQWENKPKGTTMVTLSDVYKKAAAGNAITIACYGDSITYGQDTTATGINPPINGASQTRSQYQYPETLAESIGFAGFTGGVTVFNRGFPGDTTIEGISRWSAASATDVSFIMYGHNDANNYGGYPHGPVPIPDFRANMVTIINRELAKGAAVVLLGPPAVQDWSANESIRPYAAELRSLASFYDLPFIDMNQQLNGTLDQWTDGVHLTAQGYSEMGWHLAGFFLRRDSAFNHASPGTFYTPDEQVGHGGSRFVWAPGLYGELIALSPGQTYAIGVQVDTPCYTVIKSVNGYGGTVTTTLSAYYCGARYVPATTLVHNAANGVRQDLTVSNVLLRRGVRTLYVRNEGTNTAYIEGVQFISSDKFSFGTAAYADLQTSATDATAGRVLKVGAFGLGGSVSLGLFDLNTAQVGSFIGVNGTEADAATYNWPVTGAVGTTPVWYSVLTYGTTSRTTQRATWIFSGGSQGRIWERVKHDTTWSSWREVPRFDTSSGLVVPGLLSASGGLSVGGATTIPCQPLALYDLNSAANGSHVTVYGTEADAATYNWPATGAAGATAVYWVVRTHGTTGRVIQRAVQIFSGVNQGRIFERVKHDTTWSSWRECPRLDTSAGLTIGGILTATGGLRTGLASALVTSTVAMNNGAAAATATLTNAPAAGNPTKWIPINDNGTTRYIPAW